jgi:hypothetical protein
MALLHTVKRRGVKVLRAAPGMGPTNVRRNAAFWATLGDLQTLALKQSQNRDAASAKFLRAAVRLTGAIAPVQSKHGLALATGTRNWLEINRAKALDPALDVCRAALGIRQPRVAVGLGEQIVAIRPSSLAGWTVLAAAYQALNLRDESDRAIARVSQLSGIETDEAATSAQSLEDVAAELTSVAGPAPEDPATALYEHLKTLHSAPGARKVDRAFVAAAVGVRHEESEIAVVSAADTVVRSALAYGTEPDLDLTGLVRKIVASRPARVVRRLSPETARAIQPIDRSGLRTYLDGKSICLIANSQTVARSGAGALIDGYDIVARFNSFRIDAPNTGSKTTIHAAIHLHNFNWSVPVDVRLIFSGNANAWRQSINKFVDPTAQVYLGDLTLRWPVRDSSMIGETEMVDVPTSGFNLMRLVDFLDVSTKIDLIGFDFNTSGAFRLESAMSLPIARAHDYSAERDWVMKHATSVDDLVISLR